MIRWGITANAHDAALAVFKDDELKFAAHAERSSGIKNDKHLNQTIVDQALEFGNPDDIHWYETDWLKRIRQVRSGQYSTAFNKITPQASLLEFNINTYADSYSLQSGPHFHYHRHHASHAAAGYYTSPYKDAAVLVVDSIGEFETLTVWKGADRELKRKFSQKYPHSLGLWYSAMTQRIGLKPNEDEYILMGWAAIGDPNKYKKRIFEDFFYPLGHSSPRVKFRQNLHRGCKQWAPELNSIQDYADIAAGVQAVYEYVFEHLIRQTRNLVPSRNIVLMGGCALNCVANRIAYKYFTNVWIMPNPGDAGSSIGCVLDSTKDFIEFNSPYLGNSIRGNYPVNSALKIIQESGMVGVANNRAEFGPRALGNRSLLADPRGKDMQDLVNTVKQRQSFRPFAPVIMEEHLHDYFEMPEGVTSSPFMQFVGRTKDPEAYPAITHVDGTARVQTVTRKQHPGLYKLLEKWHQATGCPMLLNTSLNIKGEPMVDTELDAVRWTEKYGVAVVTNEPSSIGE
jgi:carbamoyltransferase|tara:strand:+ start:4677 stop:6215 length:1539 start_codon:yes stop_codon:yes gene_type:complete